MSIYSVIYLNIMQLSDHLSHIDYKSIYFYDQYLPIKFLGKDLIGSSLIYREPFHISYACKYAVYVVFHLT